MILCLTVEGNQNIFTNLMKNWPSIATLAKYLLKVFAMSEGLVIVWLLPVISVGKVWLVI